MNRKSEAYENESNPAAVKRIQRALAETLANFPAATVLEKTTAVYRITKAITESAIEHSNPLEREDNKRVMREVLQEILLDTLGPKTDTVH